MKLNQPENDQAVDDEVHTCTILIITVVPFNNQEGCPTSLSKIGGILNFCTSSIRGITKYQVQYFFLFFLLLLFFYLVGWGGGVIQDMLQIIFPKLGSRFNILTLFYQDEDLSASYNDDQDPREFEIDYQVSLLSIN